MKIINTEKAPKAIGPYSQALKIGNFLYLSGQIGINPANNLLVSGFENQVAQVLKNIEAILIESGCNRKNVIKSVVYLKDLNNFEKFNVLYAEFFGDHKPVRSTVEVSNLPKNALIEIECTAIKS